MYEPWNNANNFPAHCPHPVLTAVLSDFSIKQWNHHLYCVSDCVHVSWAARQRLHSMAFVVKVVGSTNQLFEWGDWCSSMPNQNWWFDVEMDDISVKFWMYYLFLLYYFHYVKFGSLFKNLIDDDLETTIHLSSISAKTRNGKYQLMQILIHKVTICKWFAKNLQWLITQ